MMIFKMTGMEIIYVSVMTTAHLVAKNLHLKTIVAHLIQCYNKNQANMTHYNLQQMHVRARNKGIPGIRDDLFCRRTTQY